MGEAGCGKEQRGSGTVSIVTHNVKDFQRAESLNVRAIKPADFLIQLRSPT